MTTAKKSKREERKKDDDFVQALIADLNREHQTRVAWNLATDTSPTHVKRWTSTGSVQLDYAIANRLGGGCPEGRIVEIFGPPSIGKSHIAAQLCKACQRGGGIAMYIDTENAINPENLKQLGVDVSRRFIYADPGCIEDVFTIMESTIQKVKERGKDVPVLIVWDSVAATPAKAELEADYDKDSIGLAARQLSKGFRKITQLIGNQNITLVCLNQIRTKVGVLHGDPTVTPGGLALPFHSSVRVALTGGARIEDEKTKELVGINVNARVVKNKVAVPFRKVSFQIRFGVGIVEGEELFDVLRAYCDEHTVERDGKLYKVEGTSSWKTLTVTDAKTGEVIVEKKFYKPEFAALARDERYRLYVDALIDVALTRTPEQATADQFEASEADPDGYDGEEDAA